MRFLALLLALTSAAAPLPAAEPPPDPSMMSSNPVSSHDPRIAYMGRVALNGDETRLGFPGIAVRFVYRGPAPVVRLSATSANCDFNLACNGWDPVVIHLNLGENKIQLPTGVAPPQGWLVELVRRTEAWQGLVAFQGLLLPPGCELLPPPRGPPAG
jgi:hypothetical protein